MYASKSTHKGSLIFQLGDVWTAQPEHQRLLASKVTHVCSFALSLGHTAGAPPRQVCVRAIRAKLSDLILP